MKMRLGTRVDGSDGELGHVTTAVIDPATDDVAWLVVTARGTSALDRLVPEARITQVHEDHIQTDLSTHEFFGLPAFTRPRYVDPDTVGLRTESSFLDERAGWHYAVTEHVPPGMATCSRGMPVIDANGTQVGKLDWMIIDPEHDHVSHFVLSEGHLFTKHEVAVPVRNVASLEGGTVTLDLTAEEVEALPAPDAPGDA